MLAWWLLVWGCAPEGAVDFGWSRSPDSDYLIDVWWNQAEPGEATVQYLLDGRWVSAPPVAGEPGRNGTTLVGLPVLSVVPWRVVVGGVAVESPREIETVRHPTGVPRATAGPPGPGFLLTTAAYGYGDARAVVFDRSGRVVWAQPDDALAAVGVRPSRYGDGFLVAASEGGFSKAKVGTGIELWWLRGFDGVYFTGRAPLDFVELASGSYAWLAGDAFGTSQLRHTEDLASLWVCSEWTQGGERCELQSLSYAQGRDELVMVDFDHSALVAVDRKTGDPRWWIGGVPGGWVGPEVGHMLDAQETAAGTLLTVNVGNDSGILRELEIRDGALVQLWSLALPSYAYTVTPLADGGALVASNASVFDIGPDGGVRWSFEASNDPRIGRVYWIEDLYDWM